MKSKHKIAIYSGAIPSTAFIERLIEGVSGYHEVLIFGKLQKPYTHQSKTIKVYSTPKSKLKNVLASFVRTLGLLLKNPKALPILWQELKAVNGTYAKFDQYTRLLPIILYKPDIFHIQWTKDLPKLTFLKTKFNIPLIVSFRGAHINYTPIVEPDYQTLYRQSFPFVDAFHGVSKTIVEKASQYGDIKNRSSVIYSPIPEFFFKQFKPYKKRQADTIHLVSVGRDHWKKGYQYALEAVYRLKEKGLKVTYTLIGPEKPSEALLFQMHQLNITQNIIYKGKLSQKELLETYRAYDLLVLPSLGEGIANVVLEAMAVGLPVISTDCGGMPEVVINGETGWLVPMRDSEAIVNAVVDYTKTSAESLNKMTLNAYKTIKKRCSYEENISEFIHLYTSVI